jgi:hypothetical protein
LFALRELMREVLSAKLKAKKVELKRRSQQLNQQSKLIETVKPGLPGWPSDTALGSFCRSYRIFELLNFGPLIEKIGRGLQKTLLEIL